MRVIGAGEDTDCSTIQERERERERYFLKCVECTGEVCLCCLMQVLYMIEMCVYVCALGG